MKTALPKGIRLNTKGQYTVRNEVNGSRVQKSFATLDEALKWRNTSKNEAVGQLPPGVEWEESRGQFRATVLTGGKRTRARFECLEEAVQWRVAAVESISKGLPLPATDLGLIRDSHVIVELFGEAARTWHKDYVSEARRKGRLLPRTLRIHNLFLDEFVLPRLGHMRLSEITPDHIRDFRDYFAGYISGGLEPRFEGNGELVGGYSRGYVQRMVWMVDATLRYSLANGWVKSNSAYGISAVDPYQAKTPPHTPVYVEANEAIALARLLNPSMRLGLWLGRLCGLRAGEIFGLRIKDVDLEGKFIRVHSQGGKKFESWGEGNSVVISGHVERTKTSAGTRIVGIPNLLLPLIREVISEQVYSVNNPEGFLVVMPRGGRWAASLQIAVHREAGRLGIEEKDGDAAIFHDMRKSMATDLEIIGITPYLRSIIVGHRTNTSVEGGAVITSSVYTLANPHIKRIVAAGDALGDWFTEQTGVSDLSQIHNDESEWVQSWIRIEEAGALLGIGADTIKHYAKKGELTFKKHKNPNQNTPALWVARSEVEKLASEKANRITIAQAASDLGLSDSQVVRIANDNNIPIHRERIKTQWAYFNPESYKQLRYLIGVRAEFIELNMSLKVASEALQVKNSDVAGMIDRGILDEAIPLATFAFQGKPRWVTRASVEKALETPQFWRKKQPSQRSCSSLNDMINPDALTAAEAGTLMGRSSDWIRRLVQAGQLETAPNQKNGQGRTVRITRASMEKYAKENGIQIKN